MKRTLLGLVILALALSSCAGPIPDGEISTTAPQSQPNTTFPQEMNPDAIKRDAPATYSAVFNISFDGPTPWKYQLNIRKANGLRELDYHVEGIKAHEALGDVRIVTDGVTTWMTRPGVDDTCMRFANDAGIDLTFLYPENVLSMAELSQAANFVREEPFVGRDSLYYLAGPAVIGRWKDASIEYHLQKGSETLLQFAMLGSGEDNFFGTGTGTLMATYSVESLEEPAITPSAGCEINHPLPDSAAKIVSMPGLVSFESAASTDEMVRFYQEQLPQAGWAEAQPPSQGDNVVVLSYLRGAETVEIQVAGSETGGSVVKIFTIQE